MHKLTKFFSPFCINKTYIHKKENKYAYINSQNLSPHFYQFINKGAKTNQTIKDIYAIYIHEKERREVNSPCIYALHEEGMTRS